MSVDALRFQPSILVVEDEYYVADDLARSFRQLGARVLGPVASRAEALVFIDNGDDISAAVLDVNLGGEFVFEVADTLLTRNVPFVFATGYDGGVLPERLRHISRWQKPFSAHRLAESLIQRLARL